MIMTSLTFSRAAKVCHIGKAAYSHQVGGLLKVLQSRLIVLREEVAAFRVHLKDKKIHVSLFLKNTKTC